MRKKYKHRKKKSLKTGLKNKSGFLSIPRWAIALAVNDGIEAGLFEIEKSGIICPNCKHRYFNSETCPYCQQDPDDPILIREKERVEDKLDDGIEEKPEEAEEESGEGKHNE